VKITRLRLIGNTAYPLAVAARIERSHRRFRHRGPCFACGGPDARHRLIDALREAYRAGDSVELLADAYYFAPATVRRVVETGLDL
jgi:hypothetical protein